MADPRLRSRPGRRRDRSIVVNLLAVLVLAVWETVALVAVMRAVIA